MITYVVYMYTIKKEEEQKEEQKISSIHLRYRIRTQSDILAAEMRIRGYFKSKNINNVKNIIILNWKEIEP